MDLRQYAATQTEAAAAQQASPSPLLAREQDQEAAEELTKAEVYREYQEAIKRSGMAREELTKGILMGVNPYRLLIIAADCIGYLTGDTSFGERTRADIIRIPGAALGERDAMELELDEVESRLEKLRVYHGPDKYRVQAAIQEHERRAADLRSRIQE